MNWIGLKSWLTLHPIYLRRVGSNDWRRQSYLTKHFQTGENLTEYVARQSARLNELHLQNQYPVEWVLDLLNHRSRAMLKYVLPRR